MGKPWGMCSRTLVAFDLVVVLKSTFEDDRWMMVMVQSYERHGTFVKEEASCSCK